MRSYENIKANQATTAVGVDTLESTAKPPQ
jgi:hypothetical protein